MTGKREKFSLSLLKHKQNLPRYQEMIELCIDNQGISQLKEKSIMKCSQLLTSAIEFLFSSAPGKVAKNWQLYRHNIQYLSLPGGKKPA